LANFGQNETYFIFFAPLSRSKKRFQATDSGYSSRYCISVIFNVNFQCLFNKRLWQLAVCLDSNKEENKFINLTSNLTHQLKQCIENNYKSRYCLCAVTVSKLQFYSWLSK